MKKNFARTTLSALILASGVMVSAGAWAQETSEVEEAVETILEELATEAVDAADAVEEVMDATDAVEEVMDAVDAVEEAMDAVKEEPAAEPEQQRVAVKAVLDKLGVSYEEDDELDLALSLGKGTSDAWVLYYGVPVWNVQLSASFDINPERYHALVATSNVWNRDEFEPKLYVSEDTITLEFNHHAKHGINAEEFETEIWPTFLDAIDTVKGNIQASLAE